MQARLVAIHTVPKGGVMNGDYAQSPSGSPTDPYDAVCAIGIGANIRDGGLNEGATFANATLISPTQLLTVLHVMPTGLPQNADTAYGSGYTILPAETDQKSRIARFRRKTDGSVGSSGLAADYHQVRISGFRASKNIAGDSLVICDLETPVTHIAPISTAAVWANISPADPIIIAGWGLDGNTLGGGTRPLDVRYIDIRTIFAIGTLPYPYLSWDGADLTVNIYDSGGPVLIDDDGTLIIIGCVSSVTLATPTLGYQHDASLQIPGFYSPGVSIVDESGTSAIVRSDDGGMFDQVPTQSYAALESIDLAFIDETSMIDEPGRIDLVFVGFAVANAVNLALARLQLYVSSPPLVGSGFSYSPSDVTIRVRRIIRAGVTDACNWNTYDGVNAWGTAGANNLVSDVSDATDFTFVVPSSAVVGERIEVSHANLLQMVTDAKDAGEPLRLLLSIQTANGRISFYTNDASGLNEGLRPGLLLGEIKQFGRRRQRRRMR